MTAASASRSRRVSGASVNIPPRRPAIIFSEKNRRYIFDNQPFMSTLIATLSALFPEGERFFVESVRPYRKTIKDPLLQAQIAGFIGQESMHGKLHDELNAVFRQQGFPVQRIDRQLAWMARGAHRYLPRRMQLGITVGFEHLTALFAEELLRNPELQNAFDASTRPLWLWHALEESEHKTVAFDVLKHVSGSYLLRSSTMVIVTLVFFLLAFGNQISLLAADGKLWQWRENVRGLHYVFGRRGLVTRLIPKYLDYFRPGYHPLHHDTSDLLDVWREKLFGKDGMLVDRLARATTH